MPRSATDADQSLLVRRVSGRLASRRPHLVVGAMAAGLLVASSACAPRVQVVVPDRAAALSDRMAAEVIGALTRTCDGTSTLTANVSVAGRLGARRVRGSLLLGVAKPGRVRIEAVAPFGAPVFVLAGRPSAATLLLPREDAFAESSSVADLLEALVQLPFSADEFAAVSLGCPPGRFATDPRRHVDGTWSAADEHGTVVFVTGGPRPDMSAMLFPVTATRARRVAVAFAPRTSAARQVDIEVGDASAPLASLRLAFRDLEAGADLPDAAFDVRVPAAARRLTLDELRQMSPLTVPDPPK